MKHEEIYHTCDRCGVKIEPRNLCFGFPIKSKTQLVIDAKTTKTHTQLCDEVVRCIDEKTQCMVMDLYIDTYLSEKSEKLELCKDCRKDFEAFMNGASQ